MDSDTDRVTESVSRLNLSFARQSWGSLLDLSTTGFSDEQLAYLKAAPKRISDLSSELHKCVRNLKVSTKHLNIALERNERLSKRLGKVRSQCRKSQRWKKSFLHISKKERTRLRAVAHGLRTRLRDSEEVAEAMKKNLSEEGEARRTAERQCQHVADQGEQLLRVLDTSQREADNARSECDRLRDRIERLETDRIDLEETLQTKERQFSHLRQHLADTERKLTALRVVESNYKGLSREVDALKAKVEKQHSDLSQERERSRAAGDASRAVEDRLQILLREKSTVQAEAKSLREELKRTEAATTSVSAALRECEEIVEAREIRISQLEETIQAAKEESEARRSDAERASQRTRELQGKATDLANKLREAESRLAASMVTQLQLENSLETARHKEEQARVTAAKLQHAIEEKEDHRSRADHLQKALQVERSARTMTEQTLASERERMRGLEENIGHLEAGLAGERERAHGAEARLAELQASMNATVGSLHESAGALRSSLETERREREGVQGRLEAALEQLQEARERLEVARREWMDRERHLEDTAQANKHALATATERVEALQAHVASVEAEIEDVRREREEAMSRERTAREEILEKEKKARAEIMEKEGQLREEILERERKALEQAMGRETQLRKDLDEAVAQARQATEKFEAECSRRCVAEEQLAAARDDCRSLRTEVEQWTKTSESADDAFAAERATRVQLESLLSKEREAGKSLSAEVIETRSMLQAAQESAQEEATAAANRLKHVEEEAANRLKHVEEEAANRLKQAQDEATRAGERCGAAEEKALAHAAEAARLQTQLSALTEQLRDLTSERDSLAREGARHRSEEDDLRAARDDVEQRLCRADAALRSEREERRSDAEKHEEVVKSVREAERRACESLAAKTKEFEEYRLAAEERTATLQAEITVVRTSSRQMEAELSDVRAIVSDLESTRTSDGHALKDLQEALENARDDHSAAVKRAAGRENALVSALRLVLEELEDLRGELTHLRDDTSDSLRRWGQGGGQWRQMHSAVSQLAARAASLDIHARKYAQGEEAVREARTQLQQEIESRQHFESRYRREVVLRKSLYNQLMELRGNIRVMCRPRPLLRDEAASGEQDILVVDTELSEVTLRHPVTNRLLRFEYDTVFPPAATQEDVFKETTHLLTSLLDGYNVCMFSYGQTGSGKTFTVEGTERNPGLAPRAMEELFTCIEERSQDYEYEVTMSILEIYNDQVRDLLGGTGQPVKCDLRSGPKGLYAPDLSVVSVDDAERALSVIDIGRENRSIAATKMNEHSSRSHCVFIVCVSGKNRLTGATTHSKLNLVDLAGSERLHRSGSTGDRMKEAMSINKSLSALGDVIAALRAKHAHVPYRNSKLTHLLQESLGGNSKTVMFVQVSCAGRDVNETQSSLAFAARVRNVSKGPATVQSDLADLNSSHRGSVAQPRAPSSQAGQRSTHPHSQPHTRGLISNHAAAKKGVLRPPVTSPQQRRKVGLLSSSTSKEGMMHHTCSSFEDLSFFGDDVLESFSLEDIRDSSPVS